MCTLPPGQEAAPAIQPDTAVPGVGSPKLIQPSDVTCDAGIPLGTLATSVKGPTSDWAPMLSTGAGHCMSRPLFTPGLWPGCANQESTTALPDGIRARTSSPLTAPELRL